MATFIHPTAQIGLDVTIGNNVYIGPNCVIGYPAEDKAKWGQSGFGVTIGDNTILTGLVTVDEGTVQRTLIGQGGFFMKHSHVGHDAQIEDDVTLSCGVKIGGHTIVMIGATIGLNAVIHQRHVVGSYCMIGMGAGAPLSRDVAPFEKYVECPIRRIGPNQKAIDALIAELGEAAFNQLYIDETNRYATLWP